MDQKQILNEIFEENIKKPFSEQGMVIAITGQWGIGKTYFWNSFIKQAVKQEQDKLRGLTLPASRYDYQRVFDHKYAYVSLFGIESLSDLKVAIASCLDSKFFEEQKTLHDSFFKNIKTGLATIKDARIASSGVNVSTKLLETFLFHQVRNAMICLDDFERLSSKLDIKEVMGLVNYLKIERNCQVIILLDDTKTEGENKNRYAEYKEKIIDEYIKISRESFVSNLRDFTGGLEQEIQDFLIKFAETMEIYNLRFYQKVIKLYRRFVFTKLPPIIASYTKESILTRIIQGCLIEDFKNLEVSWMEEVILIGQREDWSPRKQETYKKLDKASNLFAYSDHWLNEIKDWFEHKQEQEGTFNKLVQKDLQLENNQNLRNTLWQVFEKRLDLTVTERDFEFIADNGGILVQIESLNNIGFAYQCLQNYFGKKEKADKFKEDVLKVINSDIPKYISRMDRELSNFNYGDNVFYEHIANLKKAYIPTKSLSDLIYHFFKFGIFQDNKDEELLKKISFEEWYKYLTKEIYEQDFIIEEQKTLVQCLNKILSIQMDDFSPKEIVLKVLNKMAEESDFKKRLIEDIIRNNLSFPSE